MLELFVFGYPFFGMGMYLGLLLENDRERQEVKADFLALSLAVILFAFAWPIFVWGWFREDL